MVHTSPSRWPKLEEYHDRDEIWAHWPQAQGTIYSLPPAINIYYWRYPDSPGPMEDWRMGQRLWTNNGWKWQYKPTNWVAQSGDNTLEINFYSLNRTSYWEFSMEVFLWKPNHAPIGAGEMLKPYATPGYQQSPPWIGNNSVDMKAWSYPWWKGEVMAIPVRLADMWDEVPQDLTN